MVEELRAYSDFRCPICREWVRQGEEVAYIDGVKVCLKCWEENGGEEDPEPDYEAEAMAKAEYEQEKADQAQAEHEASASGQAEAEAQAEAEQVK